jgi:predicted transposase/invertase (TIGR01784 family)
MGEKGDEVQLLGFLNAVLGKTGNDRFTSVEIIENKTFTPEALGDKSCILDVRAVLHGKTKVNVEVQLHNEHNMERRSLFYWSKEYSQSLKAGQGYAALPVVIAVNILNYDFPPLGEFHTCFHLREDRHREYVLTNVLEIHFINMVQYRKRARGKLDEPLGRWLAWFDPGSPPELIREAVKMDEAIQTADERMAQVTEDDEAVRAYWRRTMALCDYTSSMNYATEKGHAEGLVEGMTKGRTEERQRLLELLNQGLSIEEIKERL